MNGSVLILGGGRGLGLSLSRFFLKAGVPVFWVTKSEKSLERFTHGYASSPGSLLLSEALDIFDRDRSLSFVDRILSKPFSDHPLVLAVYNAGYLSGRCTIAEESQREIDREVEVNFLAPLFWSRILNNHFLSRRDGGHLFLSSGVARTFRPEWGAYGVSKGAIEVLSGQLAVDLPSPLYSLTLNPGSVATDMRKIAYPEENPDTLPSPDEVGRKIVEFCGRLMAGEGRKYNGARLGMESLSSTTPP